MSEKIKRDASFQTLVYAVAGLLIGMAIAAVGWLLLSILGDVDLQAVSSSGDFGDILMTFLNRYGIILPVLLVLGGIGLVSVARKVLQHEFVAASWARQIFFWLVPILILVALSQMSAAVPNTTFVGVLLVIAALCAVMWWWMGFYMTYFEGGETLTSRDARLAWNLLVPTLAVLLLVAARPLEKTFIASLTDQKFAGGETSRTNFVGLYNYGALLGIRIDYIACVENADGTCKTKESESKTTETTEIPVDNAVLRDILTKLVNGEPVKGVANLLKSINQPDVVQAAVDDASSDVAAVMLSLDTADKKLGSTMLIGMLNSLASDGSKVLSIQSVANGTITAEVEKVVITQQVDYPNPRDVMGDDYKANGFAPVTSFNLLNNNYVLSARDGRFITAVGNTLFFTLVAVTVELFLGLIIALVVNSKFPGRGLMRAAMLVPWAIPTVVSARLWEVMLRGNQSGVINNLLTGVGLLDRPIGWLGNADTQMWSIIFVDVWKTTPFFALLILAGLQTISGEIYEAADVDGASPVRQFFSITLPLLRPTIAVALVFRTLDSIRVFDVFDVLLGKKMQSMSTYNSFVLIEQQEFGYASAVGVTMFIIILVFTVIYVRALGVEAE